METQTVIRVCNFCGGIEREHTKAYADFKGRPHWGVTCNTCNWLVYEAM